MAHTTSGGLETTRPVTRRPGFLLALGLMPWMLAFELRAGAELCAVLLGAYRLWAWRQGLRPDALGWALLGLWLWLNLWVSPLALDPAASFGRSLPWLRFALLFLALRDLIPGTHLAPRTVLVSAGTCLALVGIDGLWQLATGISMTGNPMLGERLTGPLERPNVGMLATRLGLPCLALAAWIFGPSWRSQGLLGLICIALLGFVLLTGERSASLLLLGAVVVILLGSLWQGRRLQWTSLLVGVALVATVGGILTTSPRIQQRLAQTEAVLRDFPQSPYGTIMGAGLVMGLEHPWSGAGLKGFRLGCPALEAAGRVAACEAHPHQFLIEWFAEAGLPALLGLLLVFALLLREILALRGDSAARVRPWALGACLVVVFPLQVSQSFFSNWPGLLAWTSLGLTAAAARLARPPG